MKARSVVEIRLATVIVIWGSNCKTLVSKLVEAELSDSRDIALNLESCDLEPIIDKVNELYCTQFSSIIDL